MQIYCCNRLMGSRWYTVLIRFFCSFFHVIPPSFFILVKLFEPQRQPYSFFLSVVNQLSKRLTQNLCLALIRWQGPLDVQQQKECFMAMAKCFTIRMGRFCGSSKISLLQQLLRLFKFCLSSHHVSLSAVESRYQCGFS